ncbi:MAG TPA: CHRD domain-containing protein, partial [Solirubrobacteraceae bacterium]|nr:CHRD domain-containing protein [Solirubrobacteraceae bacterium]
MFGFAVAALLAVGPALAAPKKGGTKKPATKKTITVTLKGSNEAPTKGPAKGTGTAKITLDSKTGKVCFKLTYSHIDTVTASHIHKGGAGHAGPIVVAFFTSSAAAKKNGCVTGSKSTVAAIIKKPSAYYANIHTTKYPGGA